MASKDLIFRFLGVDAGAGREFDRMAGHARATSGAFDKMALGAAAAGAGLAIASVKMAGDFQQATNVLVTAAGESQKNLALIRSGILSIGRDTGTSISTLTDGMYQIEKAGIRGAGGLEVLKAAAQGAREENANLATVAGAITSVMTSYHLSSSKSVQVMNALKTAAGGSKTTMEEFAGSLATVLPVASAAGVSFAQVGGAIAGLTRHGTSAFEATQELANTIRNLQAPSKLAVAAMQQFGINSVDVAKNLGKRGLEGTLQSLVETIGKHMGPQGLVLIDTMKHASSAAADMNKMYEAMPPAARKLSDELLNNTVTLKDYRRESGNLPAVQAIMARQFATLEVKSRGFSDALKSGQPQATTMSALLKTMLGGATGLTTALQLTGENQAYVNQQTKAVAKSMADGSKSVEGWKSTQKLFNVQWDKFKVGVQTVMIDLGTKLLPKLGEVGGWFTDHKKVVEDFGILVGVGLVAKFALLTTKLAVSPLIGILKLMKGAGALGSGGGAVGGLLGSAKPLPVFVTNWGKGPGGLPIPAGKAGEVGAGAKAGEQVVKGPITRLIKALSPSLAEKLSTGAVGRALGFIDPASWALMTSGDSGVNTNKAYMHNVQTHGYAALDYIYSKGNPRRDIQDKVGSFQNLGERGYDVAAVNYLEVHGNAKQLAQLAAAVKAFPEVARAVAGYKASLERANDSIDREKSSLARLRAEEVAHHDAVAATIAQLRKIPGAFAQVVAQAKAGGQSIGAALDAGITIAIQQNSGKVLIQSKKVVDGAVQIMKNTANIHSPSKKTMYIGEMLAQGLLDGFTGVAARMLHTLPITVQALLEQMHRKVVTGLSSMTSAVNAAKSKLGGDLGSRNALAGQISGGLSGYADITGAFDPNTNTVGSLIGYEQGKLGTLKSLASVMGRLGKLGLNSTEFQQLAAANPEQALAIGQSLLSGNGSVTQLNSLQNQINKASNQIAMTAANAVWGKQIAADRAELAKQTKQQAEMIVLLRKIADKIGATPTAREIQKELLTLKRSTGGSLGLA